MLTSAHYNHQGIEAEYYDVYSELSDWFHDHYAHYVPRVRQLFIWKLSPWHLNLNFIHSRGEGLTKY